MSGSEQAESEPLESDPHVSTSNSKDRPIGAEIILNDLTAQLNNVLAREHRSYASILQHLRWICWALPIRMAAMRYENPDRRQRFVEQLIIRFEEMTSDARRNGHADVVAIYETHLRQWRLIPR